MTTAGTAMTSPGYLDCELYLAAVDQASLRVDGGSEYTGRPALGEEEQERLRAKILDPHEYGAELFSDLLPAGSDLLSGYREALAIAQHTERLLRFRLHIASLAPAALQGLKWELLYDRSRTLALGCSADLAFSRYCEVQALPGVPLRQQPKLLVAVAAPPDLADFKLAPIDREQVENSILQALAPLAGLVSWEILDGPVTPVRMRARLVTEEFHVLHLLAHGMLPPGQDAASVVLEREEGGAAFVDENAFAEIFEGIHALRLVALVACHSGTQSSGDPLSGLAPRLVGRGVPAVIAMRQSISFGAGARFTETFYRNLGRTGCVDRAANEARQQLRLAQRDSDEWGTPILFMRLRDGLLWEPTDMTPVVGPSARGAGVKWAAMLERIRSDNLVPFLGPGLCRGLLPSREEIAARWVSQYADFPLDERTDLATVSQFMENREGGLVPHDRLPRLLAAELVGREQLGNRQVYQKLSLAEIIDRIADRHFDGDKDEPHAILAGFPLSVYVTTNLDGFMRAALRWRGKEPVRERCRWQDDLGELAYGGAYQELRGTLEKPLVFHLYGNDEDPKSLVLTEDNYLDFLRGIAADTRRLPNSLRSKLTESMLLFLGYDVHRLDCRVLLRGVVAELKATRRGRIAVLQVDPGERTPTQLRELQSYLEGCCRPLDIEVHWGTTRDYLRQLRDGLESQS
jgi:CHAT domain/SIR2-like domain